MLNVVLKKILGTNNERVLRKLRPYVEQVNSLESTSKNLKDEELKSKTGEFQQRIERGETLEDLLPEAYAVVREVSRRTLNMRHFDCQLVGGVVLHQGTIAEMATGEGEDFSSNTSCLPQCLDGKRGAYHYGE